MTPTTIASPPVDPAELRALRQAAGLTQRELATLAGCSLAWLGNAEGGFIPRRSPTLARILKVLDAHNDERRPQKAAAVKEPAGQGRHGQE